jgi:hypothetical protein
MSENTPSFTVRELKAKLENLPDDAELIFQGGLTLLGIEERGPNLFQFEFNEASEVFG